MKGVCKPKTFFESISMCWCAGMSAAECAKYYSNTPLDWIAQVYMQLYRAEELALKGLPK